MTKRKIKDDFLDGFSPHAKDIDALMESTEKKEKATKEKPPCRTPSCGKPSTLRGICPKCVHVVIVMIQEGRTTWDELEEMGLINPRKNKPKEKSDFFLNFLKNKNGQGE